MEDDKEKKTDELLNRIRTELTAILEGGASGTPEKKVSDEMLLSPNPLPIFGPLKTNKNKTSPSKTTKENPSPTFGDKRSTTGSFKRSSAGSKKRSSAGSEKRSSAGSEKRSSAGSEKRSLAGEEASTDRLAGGDNQNKDTNAPSSSSTSSFNMASMSQYETLPKDPKFRSDFMESQAAKSIDDDLQKMQLELKKSYELFQGIGEKFESVNFTGLKNRIRDLHLNDSNNEMGKMTTMELQKMFDTRFQQNRLDKLTSDATEGFRRHPGEFGDIPELSTFFQACSQLERGLDTLRQQRQRNSELEKRMCWATEIAYDRMDEIRTAVGSDPEKNF
ncbi:hypothetical protein KR026_003990 [Drosophila bipectinata]|nr:hypothetical protein KR026_003990 [Drosophila bipectinata]